MKTTLNIAGIVKESIVDGPSIRFTIFVQGCPHNCLGCHNPQTHDFKGGKEISIDKIITTLKDMPYISGVTFSGGEPFCQAEALYNLANHLKQMGKHLMCYTGYTFEELINKNDKYTNLLLSKLDLLVDGKFEQDKKSLDLKFRGSSNQRILDIQKSLMEAQPVWAEQYK